MARGGLVKAKNALDHVIPSVARNLALVFDLGMGRGRARFFASLRMTGVGSSQQPVAESAHGFVARISGDGPGASRVREFTNPASLSQELISR